MQIANFLRVCAELIIMNLVQIRTNSVLFYSRTFLFP